MEETYEEGPGWLTTRLELENFFFQVSRNGSQVILHAGRTPAKGLPIHSKTERFEFCMERINGVLRKGFKVVHSNDAEVQETLSKQSPAITPDAWNESPCPPDGTFTTCLKTMPSEDNIHEFDSSGNVLILNGMPLDLVFTRISPTKAEERVVRLQVIQVVHRNHHGLAAIYEVDERPRGRPIGGSLSSSIPTMERVEAVLDREVTRLTGVGLEGLGKRKGSSKYRFVKQDLEWKARIALEEAGRWFFWTYEEPTQNGRKEKPRWNPFTQARNRLIEQVYMEHTLNTRHHLHFVGDTSGWDRKIDLQAMTMENIKEGDGEDHEQEKVVAIKRVEAGEPAPSGAPIWRTDANGNFFHGTNPATPKKRKAANKLPKGQIPNKRVAVTS